MNSEQWKLDGDCSICRRRDYCSKPCKVRADREYFHLRLKLMSKLSCTNHLIK